ncbi:class I SAM-dependent methyltransferase [Gorillibacterium massiliense]|uniref:class I SAM-dependent methyltransferase n=1 Tax=Gorillibacterium massiliense TaxID=1280390 RepID=UPI0004B0B974|nr:class I SAM-dependent methyltransferase [Gorillibacterium massiliense]
MTPETIKSPGHLLKMLDSLMREPAPFWDQFYKDRTRSIPFFTEYPDENLVAYLDSERFPKGRMLELGCGPGRNAIYANLQGFEVDAIDISENAIAWAEERAKQRNSDVRFRCQSVFDLYIPEKYDFVYDSGCLHHLWPHRRIGYIETIRQALKPGGHFGLTCFAPGFVEMGGAVESTDWDIYRDRSMKGGQAYSKDKLLDLFGDDFTLIEFRPMRECHDTDETFGVPFLSASLWRKN